MHQINKTKMFYFTNYTTSRLYLAKVTSLNIHHITDNIELSVVGTEFILHGIR